MWVWAIEGSLRKILEKTVDKHSPNEGRKHPPTTAKDVVKGSFSLVILNIFCR